MPVLNESQKQAIRKAWDSGVRDENALYAAAGLGAGYQGGSSFSAPVAPVGEGFVDQGGLLGLAARTPYLSDALQGLGWASENIFEPAATGMITGAQAFIPGTQMLERVSDEAAQAARDSGVGYLRSLYQGSKAAGGGAFDQPVTTGLGIDIPGSGIPMDWLAGRGTKLDEIDVGRLIPELLMERGAAIASRPLRYAAANKMSSPLLAKAIYPEVTKSKTLAGQQKLFDSPVAPGSARPMPDAAPAAATRRSRWWDEIEEDPARVSRRAAEFRPRDAAWYEGDVFDPHPSSIDRDPSDWIREEYRPQGDDITGHAAQQRVRPTQEEIDGIWNLAESASTEFNAQQLRAARPFIADFMRDVGLDIQSLATAFTRKIAGLPEKGLPSLTLIKNIFDKDNRLRTNLTLKERMITEKVKRVTKAANDATDERRRLQAELKAEISY